MSSSKPFVFVSILLPSSWASIEPSLSWAFCLLHNVLRASTFIMILAWASSFIANYDEPLSWVFCKNETCDIRPSLRYELYPSCLLASSFHKHLLLSWVSLSLELLPWLSSQAPNSQVSFLSFLHLLLFFFFFSLLLFGATDTRPKLNGTVLKLYHFSLWPKLQNELTIGCSICYLSPLICGSFWWIKIKLN